MWRFFTWAFGWHYVVYTNSCGDYVRCIRFAADNRPYIRWCNQFVWILEEQGSWRALTFNKKEWIAAQPFDAAGHDLPRFNRRAA